MRILITGITGTLGQEVTKQLLQRFSYVDIVGISRDEQKQRMSLQNDRVSYYLCDIRDTDSLHSLFIKNSWFRSIDMVFHFAALKCIDTIEDNPMESVKTNIIGTHNIINISNQFGIRKIIFTSTDKAVYPINVYGQCKAISEKLIMENVYIEKSFNPSVIAFIKSVKF